MRERGVAYAYGYDRNSALARYFGVRGIPHAVLVDPYGQIVWRGNPGLLDDRTIELVLPGAISLPRWRWPEGSEKVDAALRAGDLPRALSEAQWVAGDGKLELVAALRRMIDGPVEALREAYRREDYPLALALARQTVRTHAGTPAGAEASTYLDRLANEPRAKAVLALQARLDQLREKVGKIRTVADARGLVKELEGLADEAQGTVVAERATAEADELRARIRRSQR